VKAVGNSLRHGDARDRTLLDIAGVEDQAGGLPVLLSVTRVMT
jgi:hypothetical protein